MNLEKEINENSDDNTLSSSEDTVSHINTKCLKCEYYSTYYKKHNILFFTTDLESCTEYESFTSMVQAIKQLGHSVAVVTNQCDQRIIKNELKSVQVFQVGKRIPKLRTNDLHTQSHVIRTSNAALWLANKEKMLLPTFIIVRNANSAVSLLKLVTRKQIVYYQTHHELITLTSFGSEYEEHKKYHEACLENANEVIMHDRLCTNYFNNIFEEFKTPITLVYPCYETEDFEHCPLVHMADICDMPDDGIFFVTFGPLQKSSMFELVINAFALVLDKALDCYPVSNVNCYLVVSCYYSDSNHYNDYLNKLYTYAQNLCSRMTRVFFVTGAPPQTRKTLISRCIAVIQPRLQKECNIILEASLLNKPVIATNWGIAKELILHNISGYLVEPDVIEYFQYMHLLMYDKPHVKVTVETIYQHYLKNFSKMRYFCQLQNIIIRHSHEEL